MKLFSFITSAILLAACTNSTDKETIKTTTKSGSKSDTSKPVSNSNRVIADAATIMARTQVPVLCYHHIRPMQMPSRSSAGYEVSEDQFKAQLKVLADSGYHTVVTEQLYNYLAYGDALPAKPVMLTYDDTDEEQFSIAKPEMDKHGFKGVYFIMTISIGRPRYMSKEQLKQLSDEGHSVESHTWDHHRADRYKLEDIIQERGKTKVVNDWDQQLIKPKHTIEAITGKKADDFAYPFGVWSKEGIPEIRKRGIRMAFQLSTKRDSTEPLYTVRRIIVAPEWSAQGLIKVMKSAFKGGQ